MIIIGTTKLQYLQKHIPREVKSFSNIMVEIPNLIEHTQRLIYPEFRREQNSLNFTWHFRRFHSESDFLFF